VNGLSEAIGRICNEFNIKVAYSAKRQSLASRLVHAKDKLDQDQQSNVVYQIPCAACSASYIGQTTRRLEVRMKEHRTACEKRQVEKSATAAHCIQTGHQMDFNNVRIIDRARNASELLVREAIAVQNSQNNINSNDGLQLSQQWTAVGKQSIRR